MTAEPVEPAPVFGVLTPKTGARTAAVALAVLAAACSGGTDSQAASDTALDSGTAPGTDPCAAWSVETLATGLGALENLLVEDDGGMLLSVADAGEVRRLGPEGAVAVVVDDVPSSGGLARDGDWTYVTTGLTVDSALQGVPNGAIIRFDPASGRRETWATGLVAPNGLALLADGSAVTTRTLSGAGTPAEVTRVPGDDPGSLEPLWSDLTGTNGAAVDPDGEWLYVSRLADRAEIWRIATADPADRELVADLGTGTGEILDDLTVGEDGIIYAAAFASGKVYRVDPSAGTEAGCAIATDLPQVTAVEQPAGADGLVATSMAGTVYALTPPG